MAMRRSRVNPGAASARIDDRSRVVSLAARIRSAECVGIARKYVQRCASTSRSASSAFHRFTRTPVAPLSSGGK